MKYQILFLLTFTILVKSNLLEESAIHEVVLDGENNYLMRWSPQKNEIIFELQVATQGYIGFGFSHTGGMAGSDIVFTWVCEKGIPHISDRHGTGPTEPIVDHSQDYTLLGGFRNATHTSMHFSRPWTTCDNDHDYQLSSDTVKVIWAYSEKLPTKGQFSYHEKRGAKTLYLQEPRPFPIPNSPDIKYFDIRARDVLVPNTTDTMYWCWIEKIPPLAKKHHYIGFAPLVDEESKPFFHHMTIGECRIPNSDLAYAESLNHKGHVCNSPNMPLNWANCDHTMIGWAVGSEGSMLPDHVGIPLHEEFGGATYLMMETHYDNPFYKNKIDRSGMRIFYTEKIRKQEGALLITGHRVSPLHIIPPKQTWASLAHCSSDCLRQHVPEDGIHVIGGMAHSHLLGRKMDLRLIRDGKELEPLYKDDNYDFNYQQMRIFPKERIIKRGDHLMVTCTYDSADRVFPTFGGESTRQEMCQVIIVYYPKISVHRCSSSPKVENIANIINSNNLNPSILSQNDMPNSIKSRFKVTADYYNKLHVKNNKGNMLYNFLMNKSTWLNSTIVNKLRKTIITKPHEGNCKSGTTSELSTVRYPDFIPYKEKARFLTCTLGTEDNGDTTQIKESNRHLPEQSNNLETSMERFVYHVEQSMKSSGENHKDHDLKDEIQKYISEYMKTYKSTDNDDNGSSRNYNSGILAYLVTTVLVYWLF